LVLVLAGLVFNNFRNCSDSHQDTKTQRRDLPAIALAQARQAGMAFTPLSEKPARHHELRRGGRGRAYCKKE